MLVPPGDGPLPLVIGSHGAGGNADDECSYWAELLERPAIVACPSGTSLRKGSRASYYRDHHELERETLALVRAVRELLGDRVGSRGGIYAGFSQGAIMGAAMISRHGDEFPHLALVEGGYEYWSAARARQFATSGGRRVLFSCGTQTCAVGSRAPAQWLRAAGVEVRVEFVPQGHTPGGLVREQTRAGLAWLLTDAPGWNDG